MPQHTAAKPACTQKASGPIRILFVNGLFLPLLPGGDGNGRLTIAPTFRHLLHIAHRDETWRLHLNRDPRRVDATGGATFSMRTI